MQPSYSATGLQWSRNEQEESPLETIELLFYAVCGLPLLLILLWSVLWAVYGILFSIAYPFLFLYGALTGSSKKKEWQDSLLLRERQTLSRTGKDVLSMDKLRRPQNVSESGVIWTSIVVGPSHWQQLVASIYMLFGGSIDVYHDLIALGRSEVFQRLREMATDKGYDAVIGVRLDTSMIGTHRGKKQGSKGIEIFAYGTGVKLDKPLRG
ncbi:MAG: YbjQ family protein [Candidatus Thalassarchaeaceae archaeon]